MTKEQIQERVTKLQAEKIQLQATLSAYEGAIQDCQYWLDQFSKEDTPSTEAE